MKADLRSLLLADIGLAALCDDRIYWFERPQSDATPGIVLHLISKPINYTYKGESSRKFSRVQCNLYDSTDMGIEALGKAFQSAVSGFKGNVGVTEFKGIFVEGWRESPDIGKTEEERLFRFSIDLKINYKEA